MKLLRATGLALCALAVVLPAAQATPMPKPGLCDFGRCSVAPSARPSAARALPRLLALARLATAKYATDLGRAKADGYQILTRMIPEMGYHYLNPNVKGFDVRNPPILVYLHRGATWQLGALEWVFPKKPTSPPIQGAKYGTFGAACHYVDGTFVLADSQDTCAKRSATGARFNFWHPRLVTLHIWLWYPNPAGLYSGMNPLVAAFDQH
jgi:hypothetical protein